MCCYSFTETQRTGKVRPVCRNSENSKPGTEKQIRELSSERLHPKTRGFTSGTPLKTQAESRTRCGRRGAAMFPHPRGRAPRRTSPFPGEHAPLPCHSSPPLGNQELKGRRGECYFDLATIFALLLRPASGNDFPNPQLISLQRLSGKVLLTRDPPSSAVLSPNPRRPVP